MRKAELVNQISEKTGVPKLDVLVVLETMFNELKETLSKGENITIRSFGAFIVKKKRAKIGQDITRKKSVLIPERFMPVFVPAKELVDEVKKLPIPKQ